MVKYAKDPFDGNWNTLSKIEFGLLVRVIWRNFILSNKPSSSARWWRMKDFWNQSQLSEFSDSCQSELRINPKFPPNVICGSEIKTFLNLAILLPSPLKSSDFQQSSICTYWDLNEHSCIDGISMTILVDTNHDFSKTFMLFEK